MQRALIVLGLGVALLASWLAESDACCRRRWAAPPPCPPPVLYYYELAPARPALVELTPYRSPRGRTHRVLDTREGDTHEHDRAAPSLTGAGAGGDLFRGQARKAAKTSIPDAPVQDFADLGALLDSLEPDQKMRALPLRNAPRVAEEERNVAVSAYICAVKKEDDNDFHVILGSGPDAGASRFMTAEVSGLPEAGPFKAPLKAARDKFKGHPALGAVRTGSYIRFDPPLPVVVKGSLFYDIDHQPGVIGPRGFRPQSAWEIHPVTDVDIDP